MNVDSNDIQFPTGNVFFNVSSGGQPIWGYNDIKPSAANIQKLAVYNNSTDRELLLELQSSSLYNSVPGTNPLPNFTNLHGDLRGVLKASNYVGEFFGTQVAGAAGYIYTASNSTVLTGGGAWNDMIQINLEPGLYLCSAVVNIKTTLTQVQVQWGVGGTRIDTVYLWDAPAIAGYQIITLPMIPVRITSSSAIQLWATQTLSSVVASQTQNIQAVRIA